jgi:uncharacterized membrane protein YidH (DUF202 family)
MKPLGLILIIVGILALIYTGFRYTTEEKVVDVGPLKIDKEKKHNINWPPITGVVLLIGGVVILAVDKKN